MRWLGIVGVATILAGLTVLVGEEEQKVEQKVRAAIITGGHDFERESFFAVFRSLSDVVFEEFRQPEANRLWEGDRINDWDVVVLYDLWQEITDAQKEGFIRALKERGKGLVALHHSIANYQNWSEYTKIIGARYFLAPGKAPDGTEYGRSQWQHDVRMTVTVADRDHPVTKGLPPTFEIVDETYKGFWVSPEVHILLTTDHALSEKNLAWAKEYGKARVVYIQLGHGPTAFENGHYRTLVRNALRWVARR
ncbi:MAG: ThuA domain-containing protein [Armatimonadetes bacterium]|nr:ThuA domain-containing protein [Armatimonadota bacterium]MDW8121736.1 ThuA domain-containing protein [Armatimonadota bacterium]